MLVLFDGHTPTLAIMTLVFFYVHTLCVCVTGETLALLSGCTGLSWPSLGVYAISTNREKSGNFGYQVNPDSDLI